jgi:hypothetical protein
MDIAQLRKQLRFAIDAQRREASSRRSRADEAARQYENFLDEIAAPVFRQMATALTAEGVPFDVMTPSGGVRLTDKARRDDGIGLELDTTVDPPVPVVSVTRTRGRRTLQHERPVKPGVMVGALTEEDVVALLFEELAPWLER